MGIHHTIAYVREEPHWLLNEPDAQAYARYLSNAMRHLPVSVAQKYVDFVALGGAVMVYTGGRVVRSMQLAGTIPPQQQQQAQPQQPRGPSGGPMGQVFQFVANPAAAGADVGGESGGPEVEIPLSQAPGPPDAPAA